MDGALDDIIKTKKQKGGKPFQSTHAPASQAPATRVVGAKSEKNADKLDMSLEDLASAERAKKKGAVGNKNHYHLY